MTALTIRPFRKEDTSVVESIFDMYWSDDFREHLSKKLKMTDMNWIVAEQNDEVVGVAASREAPEHMQKYSQTDNVVEFYVAAVKYKNKGIGTALRDERIKKARSKGYKEIVFFSGETHQDSWEFHDNSDFKRVGEFTAPNGERGMIWLMKF